MEKVLEVLSHPSFLGTVSGAVIALFGVLVAGWLQRKWDREKWHKEKRLEAYLKTMEYLWRSRCVAFNHGGQDYLADLLGRMQTLQLVPVWSAAIVAYSSSASAEDISEALQQVQKAMDEVRDETDQTIDGKTVRPSHDLHVRIDDMLDKVVASSKVELRRT